MSLFRTLQNSPSVISVFSNKSIAGSNRIKQLLDKAATKINNKRPQIYVDYMESKMPTYDQYRYLLSHCLKDEVSKDAMKNSFPIMYEKEQKDITDSKKRITFESPVQSKFRNTYAGVLSEAEYNYICNEFEKLADAPETEQTANEIFEAPLIVDWDHNAVGRTEEDLSRILKQFE